MFSLTHVRERVVEGKDSIEDSGTPGSGRRETRPSGHRAPKSTVLGKPCNDDSIRGSVFGSTDVQDALIVCLAKHANQHPSTPLLNASTLNTALRRLSNVAASREMGAMEFSQIEEIIDNLLERIRQTTTNPTEDG